MKEKATIEGYWIWSNSEVKDPNYIYIQQMTFTYLHALLMLRTGTRRNNVDAVNAAKTKLFHHMFSGNHPRYQDILFQDMRDQVQMPKEVLDTLCRSFTLSRTGRSGHYQGGDACLEEINKEGKAWLKLGGGIPNDMRWRRIFRNLKKLEKLSEGTKSMTRTEPDSSETSSLQKQRRREVARIRATLRKNEYLTTPMQQRPLRSMDGSTELNPELVNYTVTAKSMAQDYVNAALHGSPQKVKKICVTAKEMEERQKVDNMTVSEIQDMIRAELGKLPSQQAVQMEDAYHKTIRSGSKAKHIDFFNQLLEALCDISTDDENEDQVDVEKNH
nr:uncharacterized protein LOC129266750 [Lytechinus pictus]